MSNFYLSNTWPNTCKTNCNADFYLFFCIASNALIWPPGHLCHDSGLGQCLLLPVLPPSLPSATFSYPPASSLCWKFPGASTLHPATRCPGTFPPIPVTWLSLPSHTPVPSFLINSLGCTRSLPGLPVSHDSEPSFWPLPVLVLFLSRLVNFDSSFPVALYSNHYCLCSQCWFPPDSKRIRSIDVCIKSAYNIHTNHVCVFVQLSLSLISELTRNSIHFFYFPLDSLLSVSSLYNYEAGS